jgi:transposase-like protein
MAHHDTSVRERVIALVEEGGWSASAAGGRYGVSGSTARAWLQKYQTAGQAGRRRGTRLWSVSSPAQDAALVAEAQRNPFANARELKTATNFPGQKITVISRLKEAGLRARHAAVKAVLTDEHQLYRLAFADSSVDRQWDRVTFSDESTFSAVNDGSALVHRPRGERYNSQYVSTSTRSGRVSVHCWGWISLEGAGILHHIEEHLEDLQYKHTLKHAMGPSVRVLYPDGVIQFQQDHFSIHDSRVVQEWLSRQANVELIDLPPWAPDMNPIQNMWSEVKKTVQGTWPDLPPRSRDVLWTLVLTLGMKLLHLSVMCDL